MIESRKASKIVMYEVNEITWELMAPFLKSGRLPNFKKLLEQGATGTTVADEPAEHREPWVSWTTVFTGVPQTEHKLVFLEQPPESLGARRIWDFLDEAGKRIGVFGSAGTWPPRKVKGFFIPGSFSPDASTYPASLEPIQELNLMYTRAHAPGAKQPSPLDMAKRILKLFALGLNAATLVAIAKVIAEIKLHPHRDWKKVSLQPVVNMAFFKSLWRRERPDFATFHTNHVAHYQHRFFRAWKPEMFPDKTEPLEVERFGDSIGYGYEVADRILGGFMDLCRQEDVILCVASSLGQQPFLPARHNEVAPPTCRIRSMERLVNLLGLKGKCEYFSTMAPQWNIRIQDKDLRAKVTQDLMSARYQPLDKGMYSVQEVDGTLVVTPTSRHGLDENTRCHFPTLEGAPAFPFGDMVLQADETRKSGCHHPVGMLAFYGARVRKGDFGQVNNMDIAPTLMDLLGVPPAPAMKGEILSEKILGSSVNRVRTAA